MTAVRPGAVAAAGASGGVTSSSFPPLRGLLPLAGLLALWQVAGSDRSPYFPRPSTWARAVAALWDQGVLGPAVAATARSFVVALAVATVVGVLAGLVVGSSDRADRALGPTLEFARAMPPAAVVPLATLLLGYDGRMKVVVASLAAVWSVLLSTRAGVRRLDPVLADLARSLGLGRVERARKVVLPALAPSILLGVRVAAPVALVVTVLVEIVTSVDGLGSLVAAAQRSYQSARVYGLIVIGGALSLAVNGLVAAAQARVLRHRPA